MATADQPVSEADRDRVLDALARHTVAGSLTPDELAARTHEVQAARTHAELERALRDLPPLAEPPLLTRLSDRFPLRLHIAIYLAVSALLVVVWALTRETDPQLAEHGARYLWPFWIMLAWGLVLVAHGLYALRRPAFARRSGGGR